MISNAIERTTGTTRHANVESRATAMRAAAVIRRAAEPCDSCQGAVLGDEMDMTAMELKVSVEVIRVSTQRSSDKSQYPWNFIRFPSSGHRPSGLFRLHPASEST